MTPTGQVRGHMFFHDSMCDTSLIFTDYFMTYLGEALLSIHEDGIPLAGAFSWGKIYRTTC